MDWRIILIIISLLVVLAILFTGVTRRMEEEKQMQRFQ